MTISVWQSEKISEKIETVLQSITPVQGHAFGRPFVTAYQLAIMFEASYPDTVAKLGLPIGGAGVGQRNGLAQYLAGQISLHYRHMPNIEGAFLSTQSLKHLEYTDNDGRPVISSLTGSGYDLSMFRYRVES